MKKFLIGVMLFSTVVLGCFAKDIMLTPGNMTMDNLKKCVTPNAATINEAENENIISFTLEEEKIGVKYMKPLAAIEFYSYWKVKDDYPSAAIATVVNYLNQTYPFIKVMTVTDNDHLIDVVLDVIIPRAGISAAGVKEMFDQFLVIETEAIGQELQSFGCF